MWRWLDGTTINDYIDRRWNWSLPQKENHQNLRKMFKTANSQYPPPPKKKKVLHTKFAECLRLDGIGNCVSWIPKTQRPKHFLVSKFWESPPKVSSKRGGFSRKFNQFIQIPLKCKFEVPSPWETTWLTFSNQNPIHHGTPWTMPPSLEDHLS